MTTRGRYTPKPDRLTVPSPTGKDWEFITAATDSIVPGSGEDLVLVKWNGVDTWEESVRWPGT